MNNKNKFNEEWWNKNPMTYKDWNLSENVRSSIDIDELKKINSEYIDNNPYLKDFFENLKNDNQENTVLDIGCGWGSSTVILSKLFKKVYSIDISKKSILATKKNVSLNGFQKKVNLKKLDAEMLNFTGYFDLGSVHTFIFPQKTLNNLMKNIGFDIREHNIYSTKRAGSSYKVKIHNILHQVYPKAVQNFQRLLVYKK